MKPKLSCQSLALPGVTGRHPFRYGLQTAVIPSGSAYGLDTNEWLMPQCKRGMSSPHVLVVIAGADLSIMTVPSRPTKARPLQSDERSKASQSPAFEGGRSE